MTAMCIENQCRKLCSEFHCIPKVVFLLQPPNLAMRIQRNFSGFQFQFFFCFFSLCFLSLDLQCSILLLFVSQRKTYMLVPDLLSQTVNTWHTFVVRTLHSLHIFLNSEDFAVLWPLHLPHLSSFLVFTQVFIFMLISSHNSSCKNSGNL